jgi:hypothetical protein
LFHFQPRQSRFRRQATPTAKAPAWKAPGILRTNSIQLFVRNGGVTNGGTASVFDSFFSGFTIERMEMRINQISISTSYSVQATLSFIGSPVPEPSGVALMFTGFTSAVFWRQRVRKSG